MEEALEILWTYARRQAIDCNGKVVIPTINQSIAAIRLIIRLEGARKNNEKKVKSKAKQVLTIIAFFSNCFYSFYKHANKFFDVFAYSFIFYLGEIFSFMEQIYPIVRFSSLF